MLAFRLGVSTAALAQAPGSPNAPPPPPPVAAQPAKAAADMQAVLDAHAMLGAKPIETLSPVKARIQPSAADAAHAVMRKQGMSTVPDPRMKKLRKMQAVAAYGRPTIRWKARANARRDISGFRVGLTGAGGRG